LPDEATLCAHFDASEIPRDVAVAPLGSLLVLPLVWPYSRIPFVVAGRGVSVGEAHAFELYRVDQISALKQENRKHTVAANFIVCEFIQRMKFELRDFVEKFFQSSRIARVHLAFFNYKCLVDKTVKMVAIR
jgi:hypothetical protein